MISCVVSTPKEMIYTNTAIWFTYRYIHLFREAYADGIYLVIHSELFILFKENKESIKVLNYKTKSALVFGYRLFIILVKVRWLHE